MGVAQTIFEELADGATRVASYIGAIEEQTDYTPEAAENLSQFWIFVQYFASLTVVAFISHLVPQNLIDLCHHFGQQFIEFQDHPKFWEITLLWVVTILLIISIPVFLYFFRSYLYTVPYDFDRKPRRRRRVDRKSDSRGCISIRRHGFVAKEMTASSRENVVEENIEHSAGG